MKSGTQIVGLPAAQFFRQVIGEVELVALNDGGINYPAAMIFGNVPPEERNTIRPAERQLFIPYTLLLVKNGRQPGALRRRRWRPGEPGRPGLPGP